MSIALKPLEKASSHRIVASKNNPAVFIEPSEDDITQAAKRLSQTVVETSVRHLPWLSKRLNRPVWAKLEHMQHTGSFKFRGAMNALALIPTDQTVIASSAGNHSLAIAAAAQRLGNRIILVLPTTASPIKRERLSSYDVEVTVHGGTLEEATAHARDLADRNGWEFLSPYNDYRVIAGQASLGLELHKQIPGLEAIVVPVGGGGLITGVGLATEMVGSDAELIGIQPACFPAIYRSLLSHQVERQVFYPSLADGLIVNPDDFSATLHWMRAKGIHLHKVDEETIAAGCLSLLSHESLLCEPSGAIGIAAAISGQLDTLPGEGPIAIILSGGNMTVDTLTRVLAYPYRREDILKTLELHYRPPEDEPVFRTPATTMTSKFNEAWSLSKLLPKVAKRLAVNRKKYDDYQKYCATDNLPLPQEEVTFIEGIHQATQKLLDATGENDIGQERLMRLVHRSNAFLGEVISWQAPSYEQASVATFDDVAQQNCPQVNYSRYHSTIVEETEASMIETLGLSNSNVSLLLTSSGMAAATLIEAWLLRHRLEAGDTIVCPPGLYFETLEQLVSLRVCNLVVTKDNSENALIEAVRIHRPRVVYIEPLINTFDLRLLSLKHFYRRLASIIDRETTVVIDGTMLSGACDPFDCARGLNGIETIYFESGSKYLQAGLDLALFGLVVCAPSTRAGMERQRRNTGTILYAEAATAIPGLDRTLHIDRMCRMTRNCEIISSKLARRPHSDLCHRVTPIFPTLDSHPDKKNTREYAHMGGVMTFNIETAGLNNRWLLNACISHVISGARSMGISMSKGVSFGYSAPRISAAWALSQNTKPFLRLSVGDQDQETTEHIATCIGNGIDSFLRLVDCVGDIK